MEEEFRSGRRRTNAYRTVQCYALPGEFSGGTLGFVPKDEAYAIAILTVVNAHQSRTKTGSKIWSEGGKISEPIVDTPSSPGSFVITMTPTCGCSSPQKPVECVSVINDDMSFF